MISLLISITLKGKVINEETSQPMGYTAITLYKDTTIVAGTYADDKGVFILKDLKPGEYILNAHFIGYEKKRIKITLNRDTIITIVLKPSAIELKEQEVTARPPKVRYEVDRKIVSPSEDILSRGGSAADFLRNVAGISVSPDGTVKVKNSDKYILFVDGRPTNLTLKDIPAVQVEYIEVITNPSSEFDAEGNAIINVVLKKQREMGYSVNVQLNTDTYGAVNANTFFGLNMGKFITYLRLNGGRNIRKIYFEGKKIFQKDTLYETGMGNIPILSLNPSFGISYGAFNFEVGGKVQSFASNDIYTHKISGTEYKRYSLYQSENTSFYGTSDYTYKGLRVLGYYSRGIRDVAQILDTSSNVGIKTTSEKPWERFYGQIDAKIGKFSLGYKGSVNNYFVNFTFDTISNPKFPYLKSYRLTTRRIVNAGYLEFSSSYNNLEYKLGLRAENTQIWADMIRKNYTNIFPSINLLYSFSTHKVYLGYRNGIWRPSDYQLLPLYYYQTFDEIEKGNPKLLPEYSNSATLGLNLNFSKISLNPEIYYTGSRNILDVREQAFDTFNVSLKEYINVERGRSFGLSFNINYSPIEILNLDITPNVYYYSYEKVSLTTYEISASLQAFLLFFALQGSLYYVPRYDYYWGKTGEQIFLQLALMTQINNLSFFLLFNDPFNIYKFGIEVNQGNYQAYKFNRIPYPHITFQLNYTFTKKFKKPKREENYDVENTGTKFLK